jgi:hypothetical protein
MLKLTSEPSHYQTVTCPKLKNRRRKSTKEENLLGDCHDSLENTEWDSKFGSASRIWFCK